MYFCKTKKTVNTRDFYGIYAIKFQEKQLINRREKAKPKTATLIS